MGDFWSFKHHKVIENRRLDLLPCLDRLFRRLRFRWLNWNSLKGDQGKAAPNPIVSIIRWLKIRNPLLKLRVVCFMHKGRCSKMQTDPNLRCEKTTNILNVSIFILSIFLWTFSDLCDHLIIIHIWPFFFYISRL